MGGGGAGADGTLPTKRESNRCRDGKWRSELFRSNVQDVSIVGGRTPYLALRMQQPAGELKACSLISAADPNTLSHISFSKDKRWKEEQRGCADLLLSPLRVPGDSLWNTPRL